MDSKRLIRRIFNRFGYELRSLSREPTGAFPDLWTWLRSNGDIKTIIDIGANNGEFAEYLSSYFDANNTIAIEPLPECARQIRRRNRIIRNLTVFECAVSDHKTKTIFYENGYSPASSLLKISRLSMEEFPQTATSQKQVEVAVNKLDDIIELTGLEKSIFIKIDVQGLENKVILGGKKVFSSARFVLIEMSFIPMYEDQPLFEEVHDLLVEMGYRFAGIKNQVNSPITGQPLFVHCLYINSK